MAHGARHNLQINPALGASSTGFENGTRVSVTGMDRPEAWQVAADAVGRGPIVDAGITPSTEYTCSLQVRPAADGTIELHVTEMDSTGAFIRNESTLGIAVTSGAAARHYSTFTTTATTEQIRITVIPGVQVDLTAYLIESGPTQNAYADGETASWTWDGTRYESASSESVSQSVAIGQAAETDAANAVTPSKSLPIGQTVETDTAQPITVGTEQQIPISQASETDTAETVTPSKQTTVAGAVETDTAWAITPTRVIVIGQAVSSDTAAQLVASKARAIGQVLELDTAGAIFTAPPPAWPPTAGPPNPRRLATAGAPTTRGATAGAPRTTHGASAGGPS